MRIRGDAITDGASSRSFTPRGPALRLWRDPRLVLGSVLVVASTVAGGFALAAADHTVSYWATRGRTHAGDAVQRADFMVVKAKVPDQTARTLLPSARVLPHRIEHLQWAASLPAGALITRDSLASRRPVVEVPVSVASGAIPANLRRGDVVDVWVSPDQPEAAATKSVKVLSRVRIISRGVGGGYDGGPVTAVVVDAAGETVDGQLIAAVSTGKVTLVRVA